MVPPRRKGGRYQEEGQNRGILDDFEHEPEEAELHILRHLVEGVEAWREVVRIVDALELPVSRENATTANAIH